MGSVKVDRRKLDRAVKAKAVTARRPARFRHSIEGGASTDSRILQRRGAVDPNGKATIEGGASSANYWDVQ